MKTTEQWVEDLESESKALKQSFQRTATSLVVFTKRASISTTRNRATRVSSGWSYEADDQERVIVALSTNNGANSLAKLELTTSAQSLPVKRLRIFNGGAQWVLTNSPQYDSGGNWIPTRYDFTVQTFVDGTLTAAEATS